ncbi:MAG: Fic family protein [Neisseria sp.]|nr:Fic family protein [Neisseria sp.]
MLKYEGSDDEYTDSHTGVLKNKLNLADALELEQAERDISIMRSLELHLFPVDGHFDLLHLQAIHKRLFGDIYPWAGEIRHIDISKGSSRFANHLFIESFSAGVSARLKQENYLKSMSSEAFSGRAAHYMSEFNAVHPFREGNGRALRAFIGQLAGQNGYCIDWKNISQDEMIAAAIAAFNGNEQLLAELIHKNLNRVESSD